MREIKFRTWFYDGEELPNGMMYQGEKSFRENLIDWENNILAPTDECTILMQYTGLKDKNGVEIYEGDIVKAMDWEFDAHAWNTVWIKEITYDNYECRFEGVYPNDSGMSCEVIGNIYENPELLGDKK